MDTQAYAQHVLAKDKDSMYCETPYVDLVKVYNEGGDVAVKEN